MLRIVIILGFALWVKQGVANAVPDPKAGAEKAKLCIACHNNDGNSTVPAWPNIAGQPPKYFIEQMQAFKLGDNGPRPNPVMFGIVQTLSDQDIIDLAAYFAAQKPLVGKTMEQWVSLGEKLYRGGNPKTGVVACSGCHDPRGLGNPPAGFPPLSGQHADYVIDQLNQFRKGIRKNDPNGIMQDLSKRMTDEEIKAVANYVSGLH